MTAYLPALAPLAAALVLGLLVVAFAAVDKLGGHHDTPRRARAVIPGPHHARRRGVPASGPWVREQPMRPAPAPPVVGVVIVLVAVVLLIWGAFALAFSAPLFSALSYLVAPAMVALAGLLVWRLVVSAGAVVMTTTIAELKREGQDRSVSWMTPEQADAFMTAVAAWPAGSDLSVNELRARLDTAQVPTRSRGGLFNRAVAAGLLEPVVFPINGHDVPLQVRSTGRSAHNARVQVYRRTTTRYIGPPQDAP